jgi:hypothetical protein
MTKTDLHTPPALRFEASRLFRPFFRGGELDHAGIGWNLVQVVRPHNLYKG